MVSIKLTAILAILFGCMAVYTAASASNTPAPSAFSAGTVTPFRFPLPLGIPEALWRRSIPAGNPMTQEKVALGKDLYFDKRLSFDGTLSCATCHDPATALTNHEQLAVGLKGQRGTRSTPTVLNAMFNEEQFWDGRALSLEEQAKGPLVNPVEMGMKDYGAVVERVRAVPEYRQKFAAAFAAEGITIDTIVKAIAAFERTLLSANSPFDHFIRGDEQALTERQKKGWELFQHKAQCINCHAFSIASPFFTDFKFHNTGLAFNEQVFAQVAHGAQGFGQSALQKDASPNPLSQTSALSELGRYLVTKQLKDIGAFKTPTLRDVELTAPFMHDGSEQTLLDVVRFYNNGGKRNPNLDERLHPLNLSEEEMNSLVEFLRALTSDDVLQMAQTTMQQTRSAVLLPTTRPHALRTHRIPAPPR